MRNLVILARQHWSGVTAASSPSPTPTLSPHPPVYTRIAVDGASSSLYAISASIQLPESQGGAAADAGTQPDPPLVSFQLYGLGPSSRPPRLLSAFSAPSAPNPPHNRGISHPPDLQRSPASRSQVRSFVHLADGGAEADDAAALCVVTAGGDICLLPLADDGQGGDPQDDNGERLDARDDEVGPPRPPSPLTTPPREPVIVGTVEQGILAAQWSPDQEYLALVTARTGEAEAQGERLLLMNRSWEVVADERIEVETFGEEAPINVGWGSKATQFHGSEGKQAAARAAEEASTSGLATKTSSRGPHTPDDDGLPRVSWRADGSFFAVSTLEPFSVGGGTDGVEARHGWHRIVRTYTRTGTLSATSDASVRGVGPALAFRPSGILMATTQRFGGELAKGRDGRHDVAFLERNGLRHGEFSLREELASQPLEGTGEAEVGTSLEAVSVSAPAATRAWRREHVVRELAWNADGSVLAVWLCRPNAGGDVVQLWTVSNYHWYLKAELRPPRDRTGAEAATPDGDTPGTGLADLVWHPEDPLRMYVLSSDAAVVSGVTLGREVVTSPGEMPHDAACVAVLDGSAVLLTPLRLQNVPPPMASVVLAPGKALQRALRDTDGPVHCEVADATPVHLAWADASLDAASSSSGKPESASVLGVLYADGSVLLFLFAWGHMGRSPSRRGGGAGHRVPKPELLGRLDATSARKGGLCEVFQLAIVARRRGSVTQLGVLVAGTESHRRGRRVLVWSHLDLDLGDESRPVRSLRVQRSGICRPARCKDARTRLVVEPFDSKDSDGKPSDLVARLGWHDGTGAIRMLSPENDAEPNAPSVLLPSFCPSVMLLRGADTLRDDDGKRHGVGLTSRGALHVDDALVLARDATSFTLCGGFVVWTDASHFARFLPVSALFSERGRGDAIPDLDADGAGRGPETTRVALREEAVDVGESAQRRVERTSLLVAAVPSSMCVVLQHSRGNLETVSPRPLVLQVVRRSLDARRWSSSLERCRTHRLDLNLVHDHDAEAFADDMDTVVAQVKKPERLSELVQALRDEDVTKRAFRPIGTPPPPPGGAAWPGKTNRVCSLLRRALQAKIERDPGARRRYLPTVLTCYVSQKPPDLEGALALLRELKATDATLAEEMAKHLCWLTDADRLFDAALGMYDVVLPLLVAQHSKTKDPREYLPLLRELRAVTPEALRRFRIDDRLGRRERAMRWLAQLEGEEHEARALEYVRRHALYAAAIEAWAARPAVRREAFGAYGDWLADRGVMSEAGLAFVQAGDYRRAAEAYRDAGMWQESLAAASEAQMDEAQRRQLAEELAEALEDTNNYGGAARVVLQCLTDVKRGVGLLCRANDFSEALRVATTSPQGNGSAELLDAVVQPALRDAASQASDEVEEMRSQLAKSLSRLAELRVRKREDPADFYVDEGGGDDDDGRGSSSAASALSRTSSRASTAFTQFTRFTRLTATSVGGMSASTMASTPSRSKKKERRKKLTGKKGSVYEEEYLFGSVQKLVRERLAAMQDEVGKLLPHLARFATTDADMLDSALRLRDSLLELEREALSGVESLYAATQAEYEEGEAARLEALREATASMLPNAANSVSVGAAAHQETNGPAAARWTWEELAAAGLFAPQKRREKLEVAATATSAAGAGARRGGVRRWRCEVLDALDGRRGNAGAGAGADDGDGGGGRSGADEGGEASA